MIQFLPGKFIRRKTMKKADRGQHVSECERFDLSWSEIGFEKFLRRHRRDTPEFTVAIAVARADLADAREGCQRHAAGL